MKGIIKKYQKLLKIYYNYIINIYLKIKYDNLFYFNILINNKIKLNIV